MSASTDYLTLISADSSIADKLEIVEKLTAQRLNVLLGTTTVPDKFQYILTNVVGARYARIGNEGMASSTQDGLSMTFNEDDFAPYMAEINAYKNGDTFYKPTHGRWWLI